MDCEVGIGHVKSNDIHCNTSICPSVFIPAAVALQEQLREELEYKDGDCTHCWTPHTSAVAL